jgi:hypothetical protein
MFWEDIRRIRIRTKKQDQHTEKSNPDQYGHQIKIQIRIWTKVLSRKHILTGIRNTDFPPPPGHVFPPPLFPSL